ncbi:MAG: glycoside hydrolase family 43 protein [Treponema sp.]|nr:glycoside hydrolase family 43 protein [Treponema sp.]
MLTTCLSTGRQNAPDKIEVYKRISERNPIMTHTFGADPTVLVYGDRVYIYMTADTLEYDHYLEIKNNSYGTINTLRVASSADLANWVYHEPIKVAGYNGIAKWANLSWAPAITYKEVNGQDKFFLYFSNNANGVGVLTADNPLGPWTDPIGKALVSRQTPNCDIPWVFDPAVFIDDDGKAYLYFGGGVPQGKEADPGSARVVMLGDDMVSLAGDPVKIDVPYFFEAIGMNKLNGRYIFSYCTNWSVPEEARTRLGIDRAVIAVMSGSNPMGPFTLEGSILRNPGTFFGAWGNNHHDIFNFKGQWYIAYHSQILEEAMDIDRKGYRVTHIDVLRENNGRFMPSTGTRRGVEQVGRLNPYLQHPGATSGISAEMSFGSVLLPGSQQPNEYADALKNGSWLGIIGADFELGSTENPGAKSITINARAGQQGNCTMEIRLGSPSGTGELLGTLKIRNAAFADYIIDFKNTINGVHDIFFIFNSGFILNSWQFNE